MCYKTFTTVKAVTSDLVECFKSKLADCPNADVRIGIKCLEVAITQPF